MHLKWNILDDHIQETEKRLSSASDLKASAGCRTVHSETQDEDGGEGNLSYFSCMSLYLNNHLQDTATKQ